LLQNHPKSFMGCIKIICDDWEAMVWLFCQLVLWIMNRKQHELSHISHSTQAKNQPASWHRVCWFAPKPTDIIHGMYQDHLWWLKSNGLAVLSVGLLNYDQTTASWILTKPHVRQHSSQKPVCFMTSSLLICSKTIPNHSWDVSRSFVMIEKQSFCFFVCWPPKLW
jgi:hypothetical protein